MAYGALAAFVGALALLGAGSYLIDGKIIFALVALVGGLGLATFLAGLCLAVVAPDLYADGNGIRGRIAWRQPVAATWQEITVDAAQDLTPQRLQLTVGSRTTVIDGRSWVGFADFVLVLASSPQAVQAMTPAARTELGRLLRLDDQNDPS